MKKNFINVKDDFVTKLNKQKKLTAIIMGILVLFVICLIIFVPKVQATIRSSEIESLVSHENLAKKATYLDLGTADQEIAEKTAITVLFSVPSGKSYDNIIKVLKNTEAMKEFNHSIFIYPIVYNAEYIEEKYVVNKDEPTVIFFESGKEKNRQIIDDSFDINTMFISTLNQLPLSNALESTEPATTTETAQSAEDQAGTSEQSSDQTIETESSVQ